MLHFLVRTLIRSLLWLRYRIRVRGVDAVAAKGRRGILFLPNHPALIDPIILMTVLNKPFRTRAIADEDRIDVPVVRSLARLVRIVPFPSVVVYGRKARERVVDAIRKATEGLREGDNFLFYPAGHIYRSRLEDLRGNSGTEVILGECPDVRVVLVRTRGLWGSRFSWAEGRPPSIGRTLRQGFFQILASLVFFLPRRRVDIDLVEPDGLPRDAGREALNTYLEAFYNEDAPPNTYVPQTLWERGGPRVMPEPEPPHMAGDVSAVPQGTRDLVLAHLRDVSGQDEFDDAAHLARDLGLDSLARTELLVWVEDEFGFAQGDADALQTVGDLLLAACGETVSSEFASLAPVPPRWYRDLPGNPRLAIPDARHITEAFLANARRWPTRAVVADQSGGVRTYRDVVLGTLLLRPAIERLEGERVGIMLPASAGAGVVYLATLFAGKTPVMVNWTVGARNLTHSMDLAGVSNILTSQALLTKLESQGTDLSGVSDRFVPLEDIARGLSLFSKLSAWLRSRFSWRELDSAEVPETAAILFTSGSETLPKAVPLSHGNILGNLESALHHVTFHDDDRMMGFLPPFHSFGLTVTMLAPMCLGLRTVYHPNPNDGGVIARLVEVYKATVLLGTPTFLNGILRSARPSQLASVRLAVTGAEKCPDRVHDAFASACPQTTVVEGYGVTECAPIVATNLQSDPRRGAIGRVLPAFDHLLIDADTRQPVSAPGTGVLHVAGPCVFDGYLAYEGPSPFVEIEGRRWYNTGDIVHEDADGVLTFRGRLKRFIKLGGEMISLPAIEAVLLDRFGSEDDEGPMLAVEAAGGEAHPEVVLFTSMDIDRTDANACIREAGLSPLYNIRRVIHVDAIPVLGTGKTDYRALKAKLA